MKDECSCPNPPDFCNDSCHSYYPMGDRYCDGIEDEAYKLINNSDCPKGFDELLVPSGLNVRLVTESASTLIKNATEK